LKTLGDVPVGGTVIDVSLDGASTCALLDTKAVRCFGRGTAGRLGYGNENNVGDTLSTEPRDVGDVPVGVDVKDVASGSWHNCVLTASDNVRCWGNGGSYLGYAHTNNIGDTLLNQPEDVGDILLY